MGLPAVLWLAEVVEAVGLQAQVEVVVVLILLAMPALAAVPIKVVLAATAYLVAVPGVVEQGGLTEVVEQGGLGQYGNWGGGGGGGGGRFGGGGGGGANHGGGGGSDLLTGSNTADEAGSGIYPGHSGAGGRTSDSEYPGSYGYGGAADTTGHGGYVVISWRGDSTSNANNWTINGATAATGEIDGGGAFTSSGSYTYMSVSPGTTYQNQTFTLEIWVKPGTQAQDLTTVWDLDHADSPLGNWVIQTEDGTTNRHYYLAYYDGSAFEPTGGYGAGYGVQLAANAWNHLVYVKSGTSVVGYLNGTQSVSYTASSSTVSYQTRNMYIGGFVSSPSSRRFTGSLDEARISNTARSADWIKTEYNNQNAPGTFYAIAAEESPCPPSR